MCAGDSEYVSLCLGCSCGKTRVTDRNVSYGTTTLVTESCGTNTLVPESCRAGGGVAGCSSDLDSAGWSCGPDLDGQFPLSPPRHSRGFLSTLRGTALSSSSCQTLSAHAVPCDATGNSGLL